MIYCELILTLQLLHDGGRYHIETSPLICSVNQRTGFYMITAFVMKEFSVNPHKIVKHTQTIRRLLLKVNTFSRNELRWFSHGE